MKKLLATILFSLVLISFSIIVVAKDESPEIKESIKVYNECNDLKKDASIKIITYVRDYATSDFGKWQIYDKNKKGDWISEINLFLKNNELRFISYFTTDPGGDTAQYLDYYFRIDGTTAYIEEDYRILAGYNTRKVTKIYLNPKGRIIDSNIKVYDLHTKQDKTDKENSKGQLPEILKSTKEFLKRYKVPFKEL